MASSIPASPNPNSCQKNTQGARLNSPIKNAPNGFFPKFTMPKFTNKKPPVFTRNPSHASDKLNRTSSFSFSDNFPEYSVMAMGSHARTELTYELPDAGTGFKLNASGKLEIQEANIVFQFDKEKGELFIRIGGDLDQPVLEGVDYGKYIAKFLEVNIETMGGEAGKKGAKINDAHISFAQAVCPQFPSFYLHFPPTLIPGKTAPTVGTTHYQFETADAAMQVFDLWANSGQKIQSFEEKLFKKSLFHMPKSAYKQLLVRSLRVVSEALGDKDSASLTRRLSSNPDEAINFFLQLVPKDLRKDAKKAIASLNFQDQAAVTSFLEMVFNATEESQPVVANSEPRETHLRLMEDQKIVNKPLPKISATQYFTNTLKTTPGLLDEAIQQTLGIVDGSWIEVGTDETTVMTRSSAFSEDLVVMDSGNEILPLVVFLISKTPEELKDLFPNEPQKSSITGYLEKLSEIPCPKDKPLLPNNLVIFQSHFHDDHKKELLRTFDLIREAKTNELTVSLKYVKRSSQQVLGMHIADGGAFDILISKQGVVEILNEPLGCGVSKEDAAQDSPRVKDCFTELDGAVASAIPVHKQLEHFVHSSGTAVIKSDGEGIVWMGDSNFQYPPPRPEDKVRFIKEYFVDAIHHSLELSDVESTQLDSGSAAGFSLKKLSIIYDQGHFPHTFTYQDTDGFEKTVDFNDIFKQALIEVFSDGQITEKFGDVKFDLIPGHEKCAHGSGRGVVHKGHNHSHGQLTPSSSFKGLQDEDN